MTEMLEEHRENWGTRGGFVLAAIGSAVGLGNLWGFPYKLYTYGGGAFLIPYIIAMICIGIPMLIMEFSLGHYTQRAAPDAFARVNKKTEFIGWWAIIMGFVIITYYPIILAYCFSFIGFSIQGILNGGQLPWAGQGIEGVKLAEQFFYEDYLHYWSRLELGSLQLHIVIPLVITWLAMYFCIFKGVSLVGKIVWVTVPLPWLMLFVLAIRGMTLDGAMEGLVYYLHPNWEELLKPSTWRFAFGQVFFSMSMAFGVMVTYASFLHRKSDLNNNAAIIALSDFATSFIAGIAIFATIGGMAFVTSQAGNPVPVDEVIEGGPGLAFVAFPYALAQLPGSAWWSLIFFMTLVTLGIDSGFSITESVLAGIIDKTGWSRTKVLIGMSLVGTGIGLVYATRGGLNWVGTIDGFINGPWGISFLGLLECAVLGWIYRVDNLRLHANERSDFRIGRWWNYMIRIIIPLVLGTLFFWSFYDDIHQPGGFLINSEGKIQIANFVGIAVVFLAPVLAILISLRKNPSRDGGFAGEGEMLSGKSVGGVTIGTLWFILSVLSLIGLTALLIFREPGPDMPFLFGILWIPVAAGGLIGMAAILVTSIYMDNCYSMLVRPAWMLRLCGIASILTFSAFLAVVLIHITTVTVTDTEPFQRPDSLSSVSYVILAVVAVVIFVGLGWCFYQAIRAAGNTPEPQTAAE